MDIAQYIAELLQQHDEVSIPGTGTFYKQHSPAAYHPQSKTFTPPGQLPAFKQPADTDEVLAGYISKKKNISANSSSYFVQKFSDNLQSLLQSSGYASVSPLGVLHHQSGAYWFEPSGELIFGHSVFGLRPVKEREPVHHQQGTGQAVVQVPEPEESIAGQTDIGALQDTGVYMQDAAPQDTIFTEPATEEPVTNTGAAPLPAAEPDPAVHAATEPAFAIAEEANENGANSTKSLIAWLIVIVVVCGSAIYLFYPQLNQFFAKNKPEEPPKSLPATTTPADTVTADQLTFADSVQQSLADSDNSFTVIKPQDTLEATVKPEPVSQVLHEVIIASLNRNAEATRIVKTQNIKGIDCYIVYAKDKKRNNILVSIGGFSDKKAAEAEKRRVVKEMDIPAYLYTHTKITNPK